MLRLVSLRCLIVDDNARFLDAATDLLQREGIVVVGVASTIAEALKKNHLVRRWILPLSRTGQPPRPAPRSTRRSPRPGPRPSRLGRAPS
jgi:hypothetical protein